ncbi:hypothetical protein LOY35_13225 [Pseudomonas sp. B21-028]|uniref:hypothetical protein n=1 Tax=Pseudomonas sp. B21-028 TaxID=2895480 RepID=UPI002160C187|nr:hypothetical protein [Pseudomonas sp. B21-028]UVL86474.1 hypothetical protein LOY35_13225 [Pseudomonas sp. B21-028]
MSATIEAPGSAAGLPLAVLVLSEISAASEEQSTGVNQINTAMNPLNQIIRCRQASCVFRNDQGEHL